MSQYRNGGQIAPSGQVKLRVIRPGQGLSFHQLVRQGLPHTGLSQEVNDHRWRNLPNLWRGVKGIALPRMLGVAHLEGHLFLNVIRPVGSLSLIDQLWADWKGQIVPGLTFPQWAIKHGLNFEQVWLGLVSLRVVTTVGVGFIVDGFQNLVELENMKYHALGTGSTAEAVGDTALVTELTTQYETDNTRATGTTTEGASANIYRTVGTNTLDAGATIEEHGIFDQASNAGGVLLDRSLTGTVTLSASESLQSTYDLTVPAGS